MGPSSRQQLLDVLGSEEGPCDLARAALLVAAEEYASLDVDAYLARLDQLARELEARLSRQGSARHQIAQMNALLFHEYGFLGNTVAYYDPRNSYVNEVLDRRTGLPLTLSLVYAEVGRRAGLPVFGISLPGHFIAGYQAEAGERFLIDPFNQGQLLTGEECQRLVQQSLGHPVALDTALLAPADPRQTVARLITNLKIAYVRRGDVARAIRSSELLSLVLPTVEELRERGLLRYRSGDLRGAARDLTDYLAQAPDGANTADVRGHLRWIADMEIRRN